MVTDPHENPHSGQGSVLLDIGGDIGALVVTMPPAMAGQEVEILPAGEPGGLHHHHYGAEHPHHGPDLGHRPHVAVVNRPIAGGEVPSLVFPEVVQGAYDLVPKGTDDVRLSVEVRGGEVTSADWPT